MMIIFAFFSIASMVVLACFSVAVLNMVIRRESAYLIEERIKVIVESRKKLTDPVLDKVQDCQTASNSSILTDFTEYLDSAWPGSESIVTVQPTGLTHGPGPAWLGADSFAGIVEEHGNLDIRFVRSAKREGCSVRVLVKIPLGKSFLGQLSSAAGLGIVDTTPVMLYPYRRDEGMIGEIAANFVPGSHRAVPVVVIARNWKSGSLESWVVCQIRPSYTRTIEDLSRMGLRTASWVFPLAGFAIALVLAYACGLYLSMRLSRRIAGVIDGLSDAAHRVGTGDFSVRVPVGKQDQLGILVGSFNQMTSQLENLRQQEKQRVVLERDIALAHEAQQYLYPRTAPILAAANVWGVTTPARIVSGDLYDFFSFNDYEVCLLCADVSGKGMSAALMMAHLQAVAHGRMLPSDQPRRRPSPSSFVGTLNRDLRGRFGDHRYATMFYGEYDSRNMLLRYVNAGHCPPILIPADDEVTSLMGGDLPVGLFPEINYQQFEIGLSSGSAVVVYSDGLVDALNSQGEEFGEERLLNHCKSLPKGMTSEAICTFLADRVGEWSDGVEQFDDTTILVLSAD